jgi:putative membrane protein
MFGSLVPLRWVFEPAIFLGVNLLTIAYLGVVLRWHRYFPDAKPVPPVRVFAFLLAMATTLFALLSPIADLSDNFLFSAHMVEHLLITMVMPPLLLAGVPGWMIRPVFDRSPLALRIGKVLTHPIVAFMAFNGIFLGYHFPVFYDTSLASQYFHAFSHLLFMLTAILTWWPVLSPLPDLLPPLSPPIQMLYLFAQTLPSQVVGAFFTFSDQPFYILYATAPRVWAWLDPAADQQLGGLIMWVIGGTFFLGAFASVFLHWVAAGEARERRRYRAPRRAS